MTARAYRVVEVFEEAVAEYTGAPYCVAVESCTFALMLSCLYHKVGEVTIPARTYVSVPQAIIHAGGRVRFDDIQWVGAYQLNPYPIYDAAKRFTSGMWKKIVWDEPESPAVCLSFHVRKILPIGRGGAILTNDPDFAAWAKRMRYDGREGLPYTQERIACIGFNGYMTPEQAARGLMLLDVLPQDNPDQIEIFPDLRLHPAFRKD